MWPMGLLLVIFCLLNAKCPGIFLSLATVAASVITDFFCDVKDALDNMNAINQYSVHMHLFGL
jgi:hypothetical protein